ncbi:MAG TPA: DUF4262 domain-containing protein [Steroidobacteraceae bacterium]|jgi:hypothetical protein
MSENSRNAALAVIRHNIATYGHHVYVVSGGPSPRFGYTIGLRGVLGSELVFAGGAFFSVQDVHRVINEVARNLRENHGGIEAKRVEIEPLGIFVLNPAHPSWTSALMLGALDFLNVSEISALQIVPDADHWTLDIPDLGKLWDASAEPAWQWLHRPWTYSVSAESTAITNLRALRGARVTEAARWEEREWEVFAGSGPNIPREQIRTVPLATLLAADRSLASITSLEIGRALWRDAEAGEWHQWGSKDASH